MKIGDILKRRKSFPDQGATTPKRRILNAAWPLFWVRGDYTLHNSELLFAAVSRISNALSAMPVQLYRGSAAVKNSLNDLAGCAPNPSMTSCQFFKTMEACRCSYGNAYAIKGFDDNGVVDRIDPVDPSRVTPILDTDSGELWYRITPTNGNQY